MTITSGDLEAGDSFQSFTHGDEFTLVALLANASADGMVDMRFLQASGNDVVRSNLLLEIAGSTDVDVFITTGYQLVNAVQGETFQVGTGLSTGIQNIDVTGIPLAPFWLIRFTDNGGVNCTIQSVITSKVA